MDYDIALPPPTLSNGHPAPGLENSRPVRAAERPAVPSARLALWDCPRGGAALCALTWAGQKIFECENFLVLGEFLSGRFGTRVILMARLRWHSKRRGRPDRR